MDSKEKLSNLEDQAKEWFPLDESLISFLEPGIWREYFNGVMRQRKAFIIGRQFTSNLLQSQLTAALAENEMLKAEVKKAMKILGECSTDEKKVILTETDDFWKVAKAYDILRTI